MSPPRSEPRSETRTLALFVIGAATSNAGSYMSEVLKAKGYPHQFIFSEASGHVDRRVVLQTMPEAFEWVWKGYKPAGK